MAIIFSLEIPGLPPTVNSCYRRGYSNVYKTQKAREWQENTIALMEQAYAGQQPYSGSVTVEISYLVHTKRRWDIDNRIKALQDCLQLAGVLKNDCQVEKLTVCRKREGYEDKTFLTVRSDY